jgi:uncharacterized membrane protein YgaE (UPF0421/DUF939 family)
MKQFILILIGFVIGFFVNNYYFKKAWRVENLAQATALQAKMSNIKGCVDALVQQDQTKDYYSDCEIKARDTYSDVYEIMTKKPEHIFSAQKVNNEHKLD